MENEKEIRRLLARFENAVHAAAKDDYQDGGSYVAMKRRADAVSGAREELVAFMSASEAVKRAEVE